MNMLFLSWPVVSAILLILHFYRGGNSPALLLCLVVLPAFMIRRPWAARILQVFLALGAVEWGRTMVVLVQARAEAGEPFVRLAFILGCVALLTLASLLVFRTARIRRYFKMDVASSGEKVDTPGEN